MTTQQHRRARFSWLLLAAGLLPATVLLGALDGCVAIADIGDIEFGPTGAGASAVGGSGGSGGSMLPGGGGSGGGGASPGGGGSGGQGGAAPTCDDGVFNGEETGVDCGGPDCDPCNEDCTNGVDDDGNELVDCADPLCSEFGYGCAPEVPQEWTGPIAFYAGSPAEQIPGCPGTWPDSTVGGSGALTAPPASCSACTCGTPTGATCDPPGLTFWSSDDCSGTSVRTYTVITLPSECDDFGGNGQNSVRADVATATGGSCQSSGGVADVDPPSWETAHRLCAGTVAPGGGCSTEGEVCVRAPAAPFVDRWCVVRTGDLACPGDGYSERTLVYTGVTDTRDCSGCSCGAASAVQCDLVTTLYSNSNCSQYPVVVPNDGTTCIGSFSMRAARYSVSSGPSGGSCAASGGAATGSATATGAVTVCCAPPAD